MYIASDYFKSIPYWEQHRLRALALGASRVRVIGGRSAAVLWNMWVLIKAADPIEFYLPRGSKDTTGLGKRLPGRIPENEYQTGTIAAVTTRTRTLLDLAQHHGFIQCFMATSSVLANHICTLDELETLRHQSPVMERVLQRVSPNVESAAEACFLGQVRQDDTIRVIPQVSVMDGWGTVRRADFQIYKTNILVEVSGIGKFGQTEEDQRFHVDQAVARLDGLTTAGYRVWAYSAKQVFSGEAYKDVCRRYHHEVEFGRAW